MDPRIPILEELAFRSWPAAEVADIDGWRARFTSSVTRRGNSVWANEWRGTAVEASLGQAESFYRARSAPPMFQVGPLSRPADLDAGLARRGYAVTAPTRIMCTEVDVVRALARDRTSHASASVHDSITDAWFEVSGERGRFSAHQDIYRALLGRIATRSGYALATVHGEPAAVGLGVCDPPWLGVFSMSTLPAHRRRGAATAILGALAEWGAERGAARVYLQVEADNGPGRALYERSGFEDVYGYHYRVIA
jgi:GNAT superfamily N-acetyltransferase